MRRSCVIDNSTLVNLTLLHEFGVFDLLRNIVDKINIPMAIREEYARHEAVEPVRAGILGIVRLNQGFLRLCSQHDVVALSFLRKADGIDAGEAEAAAQHKYVKSHFILSDDADFIEAMLKIDRYVKVIGTLHIIAWLDLLNFLTDRSSMLRRLHQHGPFRSSKLRKAYVDIGREVGIRMGKKELGKKCGLKQILQISSE